MKRTCSYLIMAIMLMMTSLTQAQIKKSPLRVLYVGGSTDYQTYDYDSHTKAEIEADAAKRTASFEKMLKQYFTNVTVVNAKHYTKEQSSSYDVTVMDGVPGSKLYRQDTATKAPRLLAEKVNALDESFDQPMLFIGEAGYNLGANIGLRFDWYCLCLKSDAYNIRTQHEIFSKPFPVKITMKQQPLPFEAAAVNYREDKVFPSTVPMWQVQTASYDNVRNMRPGLISHAGGFEDSPNGEYISGGSSAKEANAVAIGRHGNFLHWGFAASPEHLTEEGKTVLANAIAYISKFKGKGVIARKYGTPRTSYDIVAEKSRASVKANEMINVYYTKLAVQIEENLQQLREKKASGKAMTDMDEAMLQNMKAPKAQNMDEFLKEGFRQLYPKFGNDLKAYQQYYVENMPYFYSDKKGMISIDEDLKSLKIKKGDVKLLDVAIGMLEKGKDVEKAKRLLERYTLATFTEPKEWRSWYEANKAKMFFTESGGYYYLVNDPKAAGNDYKQKQQQTAYKTIVPGETTDEDPVSVAVGSVTLDNGNKEVVVRMKIHPGYHIYSFVSERDPFINTSINITLSDTFKSIGALKKPDGTVYNENSTAVYKNEAVFTLEVAGQGNGEAVCDVSYQCCNDNICYPPVDAQFKVKI